MKHLKNYNKFLNENVNDTKFLTISPEVEEWIENFDDKSFINKYLNKAKKSHDNLMDNDFIDWFELPTKYKIKYKYIYNIIFYLKRSVANKINYGCFRTDVFIENDDLHIPYFAQGYQILSNDKVIALILPENNYSTFTLYSKYYNYDGSGIWLTEDVNEYKNLIELIENNPNFKLINEVDEEYNYYLEFSLKIDFKTLL